MPQPKRLLVLVLLGPKGLLRLDRSADGEPNPRFSLCDRPQARCAIARHLGQRPADFVDQYLHLDEDGDYVLNEAPCAFLGEDNYCSIYEVRPRACREYPHTDRKNFHQILGLTLKNTAVCPAVFEVVKRLRGVF